MAEYPTLANILAGPQQEPEMDGLVYDTSNVLAGMRKPNALVDALLGLRDRIPANEDHSISLANMLRGGLGSAANWLDGRPEIGRDTLAPLGLAGVGAAPVGALVSGAMRRERPTAGRTPRSERQMAVEGGKEAFDAKGPNWMESGERLSPALHSPGGLGDAAYFAHMALTQSRGDFEKALALLKDNPRAANVLNYWKEDGKSFRAYADPVRSQSYWRATNEFPFAEKPSRLNALSAPLPPFGEPSQE